MLFQIVDDYRESQHGLMEREEQDLQKSLTKLTNKVTVSQLNDMVSESETDGEVTSPRSASDMDTHSELSELSSTKPITDSVDSSSAAISEIPEREPVVESVQKPVTVVTTQSQPKPSETQKVDSVVVNASETRPESEINNNGNAVEDRLWDRVEVGPEDGPEIEDHWKTVETKRSEVVDDSKDTVKPSVTDDHPATVFETETNVMQEVLHSAPIERLESIPAKSDEVDDILEPPSGYNSTSEASEGAAHNEIIQPPPASTQDLEMLGRQRKYSVGDDFSGLEFLNQHRVALPSFGGEEEERSEIDLDDISRRDDDSEENMGSQISFGQSFSSNSLFTDRSHISAYDNFGDKKVGRDTDGPVFMFVPKGGERLKVGDR